MPLPKSWKKNNTYGKIFGHLINLGYSKEQAKTKVENVLNYYKQKIKGQK